MLMTTVSKITEIIIVPYLTKYGGLSPITVSIFLLRIFKYSILFIVIINLAIKCAPRSLCRNTLRIL